MRHHDHRLQDLLRHVQGMLAISQRQIVWEVSESFSMHTVQLKLLSKTSPACGTMFQVHARVLEELYESSNWEPYKRSVALQLLCSMAVNFKPVEDCAVLFTKTLGVTK